MVSFREAVDTDAEALARVERAASLAALAHVFPPDRYPYPSAAVLERWREILTDPDIRVQVVDGDLGIECAVAHDATVLRHLAVHPERWGQGLGRAAVDRAVSEMTSPRLWCLEDNVRARAFYDHLGWTETGRTRRAEWPPFPIELEMARRR